MSAKEMFALLAAKPAVEGTLALAALLSFLVEKTRAAAIRDMAFVVSKSDPPSPEMVLVVPAMYASVILSTFVVTPYSDDEPEA